MIERWSGKKIKMGPKCFGEFVGTAVLVLWAMAYWLMCCSGIQGGGWGLVDDIHWLGVCYCFRRIAAIACGSPDPALNPAVTLGVAIETGDFSRIDSVPGGANAGRYGGRVSGVAELPAPLEPNGRSLREGCLLLKNARD
jgi:hypothetical protein